MNESTLFIKFKVCCYTCQHRETECSETRSVIVSGGPIHSITLIRCEHDQVCATYLRNAKEEQK